MARQRVIYQSEAAFIGPAIISGLIPAESPRNLERVTSLAFGIQHARQQVVQLGRKGVVEDPILAPPIVNFDIEYLGASLKNEQNAGLNVNFSSGLGQPSYYFSNQEVSLVSGFCNEENRSLDRRNLYIAVASEGEDVENNPSAITGVIGFSNCHLTSYTSSIEVGGFVQNAMSFVATDVSFSVGAGEIDMPVVNFKDVDYPPTHTVTLPAYQSTGVTALRGTQAQIEIRTPRTGISNIGLDTESFKPQSYNLELSFNREPLEAIGFDHPLDQVVNFPIKASVGIASLVSERTAGRIGSLVKNDEGVDITIQLYTPPQTEDCTSERSLILQYQFINAVLTNHSEGLTIGENKQVELGFTVNIDPDDLSRGLFISGNIN